MAEADLRLRDIIIDGVNGYDYVQLQDEDKKFKELEGYFGEFSPAPKGVNSIQKINTDDLVMTESDIQMQDTDEQKFKYLQE